MVYDQEGIDVEGVIAVRVDDSAKALGIMASNFYGNPSSQLKLVGITGTNGKTTTVTLLTHLFRNLGYNVGMLSTVENKINDEVIPATHTTPDPVQLNELMSRMVKAGCTHCFMEGQFTCAGSIQGKGTGIQWRGIYQYQSRSPRLP